MSAFSLAKLDITSRTQKLWMNTLMVALHYNRGRHNILQKWVAGREPLTEVIEEASSDAPVLTFADLMDNRSLVVQINYLYQLYTDLNAEAVISTNEIAGWYFTPPTYEGSYYKLNDASGNYPPLPGYVYPDEPYPDGTPAYTTLRMPAVVNYP